MAEDGKTIITFDRQNMLGSGGFGHILLGAFNGEAVAVKRIENHKRCHDREEKALKMLDHPNVMKLLGIMDSEDYRNYALELCAGSLDQLFLPDDDPKKYKGPPLPRHMKVLLQLAEGLAYIHSKGLVHRDIKPANVLISIKEPVTLKWADFGLTKETDECGTYEMSGLRGTLYWMAPEILDYFKQRGSSGLNRFTALTDVFSTGCLFFSFLTRGMHPFGNNLFTDVPSNIESNNPVNFLNTGILPDTHFCHDCIKKMLSSISDERWPMSKVVSFLLEKKKMELYDLCSLSDPTDAQVDQLALLLESMEHPSLHTSITLFDGRVATPLELLCLHNRGQKLKQCIKMLVERQKKNQHLRQDGSHIRNDKNFFKAQRLHGIIALFYICGGYTHADLKEIIQFLLDHTNIDFNRTKKVFGESYDIFSETLHNARLRQHLDEWKEIIKILKNYGFRMNHPNNSDEMSALHRLMYLASSPHFIANEESMVKIVELLLDNGINVNGTHNGDNALHLLLMIPNVKNELEIIRILIKRGIDINKKNSYRENALNCLLTHAGYDGDNRVEIIRLLIKNGINVNSRSQNGRNAIHNLLLTGFHRDQIYKTIKVLERLLESGIDVNAIDANGWNGLFYLSLYFLVETGSEEANITKMMAKMLIEKGINVHLKDKYGHTALHYFVSRSHNNASNLEMIELLKGIRVK